MQEKLKWKEYEAKNEIEDEQNGTQENEIPLRFLFREYSVDVVSDVRKTVNITLAKIDLSAFLTRPKLAEV